MATPDKEVLLPAPAKAKPCTLADAIRYITGNDPIQFEPFWPPSVFGLCAYLLSKSGGYIRAIRDWPPTHLQAKGYAEEIERIAEEWHRVSPSDAPAEVKAWWQAVLDQSDHEFGICSPEGTACENLLLLCTAADEACAGTGIPDPSKQTSNQHHDLLASYLLRTEETLSSGLRKEICRVFPKSHTPQSGITLRSLSHHLSFLWGADVVPA